MSFADDLNSVAKTPQQVADEKKKWAIELGEQDAKTDYDSIIKPVISRGRHKRITDRSYYLPGGFPTGTSAAERRRMLAKKRRW